VQPVDSRDPADIDRATTIYRGRPDARQEVGTIDGRADRAQADVAGRVGVASTRVDRAATTVTRAASSSAVGLPRTTLTSGSVFIDRAYDGVGEIR
jgi:hypothetical protein